MYGTPELTSGFYNDLGYERPKSACGRSAFEVNRGLVSAAIPGYGVDGKMIPCKDM